MTGQTLCSVSAAPVVSRGRSVCSGRLPGESAASTSVSLTERLMGRLSVVEPNASLDVALIVPLCTATLLAVSEQGKKTPPV